jgi:hypothetical protein
MLDRYIGILQAWRAAENKCIQYRHHHMRSTAVVFYIQRHHKPSYHINELRDILLRSSIHDNYTWEKFIQSMVTYIRTSLWHHRKYNGMSTVSTPAREAFRYRIYNQPQRGSLAMYEPALLWWHHTDTYYDFTSIRLALSQSKLHAQINESTHIYTLKPSLHHPYTNHLLAENHINMCPRFNPPRHQLGVYGRRL